MGRPLFEWTQAIEESICDRIAEGEYLTDICDSEGVPSYHTVRNHIKATTGIKDGFCERIARAGVEQADHYRWRISKLNDSMTAETWQFKNAQIRNIQWLMAKLQPKAYGDKLEHSGPGEGGAIPIICTIPRPPKE